MGTLRHVKIFALSCVSVGQKNQKRAPDGGKGILHDIETEKVCPENENTKWQIHPLQTWPCPVNKQLL